MHVIANLWWLWLILSVVTLIYGGYNQVARMKRLTSPLDQDSFFKGMVPLFLAAILNMVAVILLVTSLVLNIIDYTKQP